MKLLFTIKAAELQKQYKSLGADISRLIGGVDEFKLLEREDGLRIWEPTITGDGSFYSDLNNSNNWYYFPDKPEYSIAKRFLGTGAVLEVGCGEGFFATKQNLQNYVGLELNKEAVEQAKVKGLDVRLSSFHDFSIHNKASMGTVCSFQVLEHLADPEEYFRSANLVLQEGGVVITAVPAEDSFAGTIRNNCLNAPPHHVTRWTNKCLRTFPEQYGFRCIEIINIPVEPCHYEWFWSTLLGKAFSSGSSNMSKRQKLKRKIVLSLLKLLGALETIPEDLCIPGHTVLAVHRKVSA